MSTGTPVRLDEVCTVLMGQAPSGTAYNDRGEGWPLIAGAGDFGRSLPAAKKFTTEASKLSRPGDIVLGIRASIGAKVLSDGEYCLGRGVAALRPTESLDRRFLWHWLTTNAPQLAAKGKGATFKQVNRQDIGEMPIVLPNLTEQRRIAEVLDRADALRIKRREALALVDDLTRSVFTDMFGQHSSRAKWRSGELQTVVRKGTLVTYGIVQAGDEVKGGVPYIRTGDLVNGEIRLEGLRHTAPEIALRFERSAVLAGDLVMSIRATVGTTAMVPTVLAGANLTQGTARISPGDHVRPRYLLEYLRSDEVQSWIKRQIKGATFLEITLGRLRELQVLLPPKALQEAFDERMQGIDRLRATARMDLLRLDDLFASLQQRAFQGAALT